MLIVGLGPAGASLSCFLSEKGLDVVAVEMRPSKAEVACGEIIPERSSLAEAVSDEMLLSSVYRHVDEEIVRNRTDLLEFHLGGRVYEIDYRMLVLDRKKFINSYLDKAIELGMKPPMFSSAFTGFIRSGDKLKSRVITKEGTIYVRSKYLVGADGAFSRVAREAGLSSEMKPEDLAFGFRALASGRYEASSVIMKISPSRAPGGYLWVIPFEEGIANLGLGIRRSSPLWRSGREILLSFIGEIGAKSTSNVLGRHISVGGFPSRVVNGEVLLVGDAAGTCIPINGGGIFSAVMSSHIAAEHISAGDLNLYETRLRRDLFIVSLGLVYRRAADLVMYNEKFLKILARLIPSQIMRDALAMKKTLRTYPLMKLLSWVFLLKKTRSPVLVSRRTSSSTGLHCKAPKMLLI